MSKSATEGKGKVEKVMHEFKEGMLKSSSGQKVTDRKQAGAVALSEARQVGARIPKKSLIRCPIFNSIGVARWGFHARDTGLTEGSYTSKEKFQATRRFRDWSSRRVASFFVRPSTFVMTKALDR
jgi:hypothetical protein